MIQLMLVKRDELSKKSVITLLQRINDTIGSKQTRLDTVQDFFVQAIIHFLKMCPIFVGSVDNFGRSDDDLI